MPEELEQVVGVFYAQFKKPNEKEARQHSTGAKPTPVHQYIIDAYFHSLIPPTGAPDPHLAIMPAVEWAAAE